LPILVSLKHNRLITNTNICSYFMWLQLHSLFVLRYLITIVDI